MGWVREAIQEGDAFLKAQAGYSKIDETTGAIFGQKTQLRSAALSNTEVNHLSKIASDLAAYLTDIKPFWEYRTHNKQFERHCDVYSKLSEHWYNQRFIDLKLGSVIKYWEVAGTGFPHLHWNSETQDIDVSAEDPRDVLPIRPADNLSIQSAAGVVIRKERTVNYLRARYPQSMWHLIRADRDGSSQSDKDNTRLNSLLEKMGVPSDSPFMNRLFGRPTNALPKIPMADYYQVYMKDERRNDTSHPVFIGEFDERGNARNNWSYIVPPGGLLYPRGRLIVATNHGVLHDGPNIYWHGLFPVPKLTLDPWPWSWLGKAPLQDLLPLQDSLNKMLRVVDDHMAKGHRGVGSPWWACPSQSAA